MEELQIVGFVHLILYLQQDVKAYSYVNLRTRTIMIINEIFMQDVHFSVTHIAINIYRVKLNDNKLLNKNKN